MTDIDYQSRGLTASPDLSPDELYAARMAVCARSDSAEDASQLMKMLGLL